MKKIDSIIVWIFIIVLIFPIFSIGIKFQLMSILLIIYLFTIDRLSVGIFLALFFRPIGQYISDVSQINLISSRNLFLLGFFLILSCGYKKIYKHFFRYGLPVFLILFSFIFLFYIIGPQSDYSNYKLTRFFVIGLPKVFLFFVFFTQKIDCKKIVNLFFLTSILYITAVYNFELNSDFFFEFGVVRLKTYYANSHLLGNYPLIAISILLGQWFYEKNIISKLKNNYPLIAYAVITVLTIFISGARQSILFLILIPTISLFIYQRSFFKNFRYYFLILIFSIAGLQYLYQSNISLIQDSLSASNFSELINRADNISRSIDIISSNPLVGKGLGGFAEGLAIQNKYKVLDSSLNRAYPHNIIIEIITEMGLIGLLLIILFFSVQKGILNIINSISESKFYIFPLILGINVKYLISYDLSQSVEFFSFIIAYLTYKKITNGLSRNSNIQQASLIN